MAPIPKILMFSYFMYEKFNDNAKDEKFTNMLGIAVRLIIIDPLYNDNLEIVIHLVSIMKARMKI